MTMAQLPKSASKAVSRTRLPKPRRPLPKLNAAMPCDTAFRVLAGRYLKDLIANHEATCKGDTEALHQMRISLTHLRAAIQFFSPMVDDPLKGDIRDNLKWLNGELGALRDLDVAIAGIKKASPGHPLAAPDLQVWQDKRAGAQRELARSLKSARYRRLIERTSAWIDGGGWATKRSRPAAKRRAM